MRSRTKAPWNKVLPIHEASKNILHPLSTFSPLQNDGLSMREATICRQTQQKCDKAYLNLTSSGSDGCFSRRMFIVYSEDGRRVRSNDGMRKTACMSPSVQFDCTSFARLLLRLQLPVELLSPPSTQFSWLLPVQRFPRCLPYLTVVEKNWSSKLQKE